MKPEIRNEEFEIHTALSWYSVLQYKSFIFLHRRWKRLALKLYSGGQMDEVRRAYWWQQFKAVTAVVQHSGWWNNDENRPMTAQEYTDSTEPRIPGDEWKKLYPGSPAWSKWWQEHPADRSDMMRYQYRIERNLEQHGYAPRG